MFATVFLAASFLITSVLGVTHTVTVGMNATRTFTPSELVADLGDVVTFNFVAGNHTATQSTFADPCTASGFKSGFLPANANSTQSYSILINATTPVWVYCGQVGHCQAGMVMAINAATNGTKTFAAFQAAAMGNSSVAGGNTTVAGGVGSGPGNISSNTTAGGGTSAGTQGIEMGGLYKFGFIGGLLLGGIAAVL